MTSAMLARFVILGEVHDNAEHHRVQAEIFAALLRNGRKPALAMEQFDREHQPALDAARGRGEGNAERLADAGAFDRKGWRWADYKPLVELALDAGVPILAANFSRADARALMQSGKVAPGLPPVSAETGTALEKDIVSGHCGHRPAPTVLAGMVQAQRARDAAMAGALQHAGAGGAILIAGAGHARRDRGVPAYMPAQMRDDLLSVGFVESTGPVDLRVYAGIYDYVWVTTAPERIDPCESFKSR
ncbi:MAG: ChaN family lipoprotein [Betaproteobacteria bacterium]